MITYVVRTNNTDGFDTRASATMPYTHAVVSPLGFARSWHLTEAAAAKAISAEDTGYRVVPVEAHKGAKAAVVKRLQAEAAPAAPAKAPAAKKAAAADAPKAPRTLAATKGEQECRVCHATKPLTAFPTKVANAKGEVLREDRCRPCRTLAREAAAKAKAKGKK